jgi:hypothetical protein
MRRTRSIASLFPAASLGALLAISVAARADTIGTAGAVNTTSSGTPPAGPTRLIEIGEQVVENEKIQTSATGSVQVLFIDKTALNVGPSSTLIIDRFVYNPVTTKGEVALSLGKGVLRVVGGFATHWGGATVATPVASFGVRGGIATISFGPQGARAILGFGHLTATTVCARSAPNCEPKTVEVSRPGYGVTVGGPNQEPSPPTRMSSQDIAKSNAQLTSRSGQTGGASQLPTDTLAAGYNVGTPNSPVAPIPNTATSSNTASSGRNALLALVLATQQTTQQGSQTSAASNTANTVIVQAAIKAAETAAVTPPSPPTPPTPPTPPSPPPVAPATYSIVTLGPYSTTTGASPVPYLTGAFAGTGGFTVTPILGYQAGGSGASGTISRQFQAGLSVTGQGASQNATLFVMTSQISNSPNIGFAQTGGFEAVTIRNPAQWYGLAYGAVSSATPTSAPNTVPNVNGTPNGSYTLNNYLVNGNTGAVSNSQSYNFVSPAGANYNFNPISTGTPTLSASAHPNQTLQGYVGGMMVTASGGSTPPFVNYTAPYIVTNVSGNPGDVSIYLPGNSSQMGAVFNVASVNAPAGGLSTSSYLFGSYNPSDLSNTAGRNTARGTYVSPMNFAGRAAAIFNNGANTPLSTRNGQALSAIGGYANQLMVTANSVGAQTASFLSSISSVAVQPCACKSTQWGFWSVFNGADNSNGQLLFEDQGNLLLWVAGVPTTPGSLPATGAATYTGHAIANITTPGLVSYLSAGSFSNTVNFGTRSGAVTIGGLDGTNYAGTVALTPSTTLFGGTLTGNVGSRTATLAGSFFQGGPTNTTPLYGEMGGSINLSGTNYLGSGIFVARKP